MQLIADFHIHTVASGHAYSTIEEYAEAAKKKGLKIIAITDHGPAMPGGPHYYHFSNLVMIPQKINGVRILRGAEVNIINEQGQVDLEKNELNGKSIVRFAVNDLLRDVSVITWGTKYSYAFVVKETNSDTKYLHRDSSSNVIYILLRDSGDKFEVRASNGTQTYTATETAPSPARGSWWVIIVTVDFTSGDLDVYLNSDTASFSGSGSAGSAPAASYPYFPSASLRTSFDLAEFIIWNGHVLTGTEVGQLNDYFQSLYNIP